MAIRVMRIRSEDEVIFVAISESERYPSKFSLDLVKRMLDEGEASVLDVDPHGHSILNVGSFSKIRCRD